jgi:hypothetical protein
MKLNKEQRTRRDEFRDNLQFRMDAGKARSIAQSRAEEGPPDLAGWADALATPGKLAGVVEDCFHGNHGPYFYFAVCIIGCASANANKAAQAGQLIAAEVYRVPQREAVKAWKDLVPARRQQVNREVEEALEAGVLREVLAPA